jgi:hypothetical protein
MLCLLFRPTPGEDQAMNGKALARPPARARISRRGCWRRNAALGTTAALLLASVATSASANVYTVVANAISGFNTGINTSVNKSSDTPPVETSFGGTSNLLSFSAVAAPGILQASASVNTGFDGTGFSLNGTADAEASMALDNIVISGPATSVMYSVNFTISGSVTLSTTGTPDAQGGIDLLYNGGASLGALGVNTDINDQTAPTGVFAGIIDPTKISVSGTTPETSATVGEDISVGLGLLATAQADSAPGSTADLIVDFSDPFTFPTSGPVFNFFDPTTGDPVTGFTANSSDGCIVKNAFVCGSLGPTGSVPELSTWAMMLAGFAGLRLAGWRVSRGDRVRLSSTADFRR